MLVDSFAAPLFAAAGTLIVLTAPLAAPPEPARYVTVKTPDRPGLALQPDSALLVATFPGDDNVIVPPAIDRWILIVRTWLEPSEH